MTLNKVLLKKSSGEVIENPSIDGLKIDFFGSNNIVEIEEGSIFHNCHFKMRENNHIVICKTHQWGLRNTIVDLAGSYDGYLKIDSNTSIESCRFAMANERKPYIYI